MDETHHRILRGDARDVAELEPESVALVVTSPPYPMIEMWDGVFAAQSPAAARALAEGDGPAAFEAMHAVLDDAWRGVARVLRPGGLACVNVGDATRSVGDRFRLYANHARVQSAFLALGFDVLPGVLWRKQTNAPTKFLGSGTLPAGAYVTLEHEHVLVFRKGGLRAFDTPAQKALRMESAFFWEERNRWFSDVWDFKGARQDVADPAARERSGAFPFEMAHRLVNMFSVKGDLVLDPFVGTGTTCVAALASQRHSVGVEIDPALQPVAARQVEGALAFANEAVRERLQRHADFAAARARDHGPLKYLNRPHQVPVMTRQETHLSVRPVASVRPLGGSAWAAAYGPPASLAPQEEKDAAAATPETVA